MEAQTHSPARRYRPREGGQKAKVLERLRAASPHPVSRDELAALVGRASLKLLIFKMKRLSLIAQCPRGYHLPGITPPPPIGVEGAHSGLRLTRCAAPEPKAAAEVMPPVPPHLRVLVSAVIRRAHGFRLAGSPAEAVRILTQAAGARGLEALPAIRADLLALADLFAAHDATYPELDLRRAA